MTVQRLIFHVMIFQNMHFKNKKFAYKYGFNREKVFIFRQNDWVRALTSVDSNGSFSYLNSDVCFVEPWNRPHLSLEDLYSLRNVNEYFNSQIDQYLKYRFIATYELEDPFLFLLTWIDTTNEETVQNWHILTPFIWGQNQVFTC